MPFTRLEMYIVQNNELNSCFKGADALTKCSGKVTVDYLVYDKGIYIYQSEIVNGY